MQHPDESAMTSVERFTHHQASYPPEAHSTEQTTYSISFESSPASWQINYPYFDPEYSTYQHASTHSGRAGNGCGIPLHAPVPISGYTTLLASPEDNAVNHAVPPFGELEASPTEDTKPYIAAEDNPLDVYLDAPQVLFPTPSELLADLNERERATRNDEGASAKAASDLRSRSSTSANRPKADVEEPESLNQRKAYFRSVSENVGFTITDPDTITSHDKKRCYLECLEEYVQWLHEQLRLVGQEPLTLERVSSYRGLKSRSIRTMLVHKQDEIRKLNEKKLQAEQKFMELQNALVARQATEDASHMRGHGIAMESVPGVNSTFVLENR